MTLLQGHEVSEDSFNTVVYHKLQDSQDMHRASKASKEACERKACEQKAHQAAQAWKAIAVKEIEARITAFQAP